MPRLNSIQATRHIVAENPHTAVLVLRMFEDGDSVFAAMQAGAVRGSAPIPIGWMLDESMSVISYAGCQNRSATFGDFAVEDG